MSEHPAQKPRILVAPAAGALCEDVQQALGGLSAEITCVHDLLHVLEHSQTPTFDAAVVALPASDEGLEVIERLAATNTPVVALADDPAGAWRLEALRRGAFDCLARPFAPEEIAARIEQALRWHKLLADAQEELRGLQRRCSWLETILNSLDDGVLVVNAEGQLILSNPAACEAMGMGGGPCYLRPLDNVIRDPNLLRLIHQAVLERQEPPLPLTAHTVLSGRTYLARVVPLETPEGEIAGAATLLRDVTEHVTIEEAKSWFTSKVAHELKAPLAAVLGYIKAILARPDMPREQVDGILARCAERLNGMADLVRDLLDLARAETVGGRHLEPLALKQLAAEVVEQQALLAERNQVNVEVDVPEDLPPLYADRDDVVVLLSNLVTNAIKYNRPGGRVTITARQQGDWLRLEVADTGLGIPAELIPRLGQEFFRINLPDRRHVVGTGLGMSLVKRTVEAYHGRLDISSKEGEGSVFTVWLPLGPPDAQPPESAGPWDLTP